VSEGFLLLLPSFCVCLLTLISVDFSLTKQELHECTMMGLKNERENLLNYTDDNIGDK